jgi:methyl-accepting chemotaxis protein
MFTQSEKLKQVVLNEKNSVQKSSSASHEISSMVGTTADAAATLNRLADESHKAVSESADSLSGLTELVNRVDQSSQALQTSVKNGLSEISTVTATMAEIREKAKIINEIVFQTKLLSFNASVEAARAGEHGRGFAVVAEEMGNLARASGEAAKEIETILNNSVEKTTQQIDSVTKDLEQAATETIRSIAMVSAKSKQISEAFGQLESYSKTTEEKAREISEATREQKLGIEEISKSLHELEASSADLDVMAGASHENSAALSTSIEQISGQFSELAGLLGFKLTKTRKPFDFAAAISAHIDWKMKLSNYLMNPDGSLDDKKVCVDNACALGKWLHGDGQAYREMDEQIFDELKKSHAVFHKTAGQIILHMNRGSERKLKSCSRPAGLILRFLRDC